MIVDKHLMENGRHPLFRRWKGGGDRNESNDDWEVDARQFINVGPQLDEGIDVGRLLNGALPLEEPPIGLKGPLSSPIMMPTAVGMPIA